MTYVWGSLAFVPLLVVLVRYLAGRTVLENSMLLLGLGMYGSSPEATRHDRKRI